MTVLKFGSRPQHFVNIGNVYLETVSTFYIDPDCIGAVELRSGASRYTNWVEWDITGETEIWTRAFHGNDNPQLNDNDVDMIVWSGGGTDLFRLRTDEDGGNSYQRMELSYWNGTGWTVAGTSPMFIALRQRLDIRINVANSGHMELYVDGNEAITFAGDTLQTGQTTIDKIKFLHTTNNSVNSNDYTWWSGCIVADEDTRGMSIAEQQPTGNGNYTAWTGDYTNVDSDGLDDADVISTDVNADRETFTKTAIDAKFDDGYDVVGLGIVARARKADTGLANMQLVCRSGTTDGDSANIALGITYAPYSHIFTQDPDTVAAWDVADAESAEIGVEGVT